MKFNLIKCLMAMAVCCSLFSCNTSKTVLPYFTDIRDVKEGSLPVMSYMPKLQPDDELSITVNSTNPSATAVYNLPYTNPAVRGSMQAAAQPQQQTYVVDSKGDIKFPLLGEIHVQGMTVEQLREYLTERISKDVKDPMVNVRLLNFKVYVAGEVKNAGPVELNGNRCTILDAITAAGDLTEYGERSNVLVIREENGERKFAHLDLNSSDILSSPYYYVNQNDYIYIEPNATRQANSKYNQNNSYKLSLTSTIVSAASVIASLVIALTIK